jgi:hypothetical protein
MEPETVTVEIEASAAKILRALQEKAVAHGVTLETLLRPLIEENGTQKAKPSEMAPEERADELIRWLKAHSVKGVIADDSRENIYTREDEAL